SASFASVDNNSSPLFGLLVRFRDSKNYYWCYRLIGGTSVVRIAKGVKGVETVLKSVGIMNPQREQFFSLGCQAQGETLTVSLNGAKALTASDSTFSSGSVGMSMGYRSGTASSHRADHFTATVQ